MTTIKTYARLPSNFSVLIYKSHPEITLNIVSNHTSIEVHSSYMAMSELVRNLEYKLKEWKKVRGRE